jgi:hypothetical protein
MIEALRGLGYTTATALADLIDNSLSANADRVDLLFAWDEHKSTVTLLDNGRGMNEEELERAMRLGDRNPLQKRLPTDLGRFGLGLKTASFSQCRKLTVASKQNGHTHCFRWDLDILAACDDGGWYLLEGAAPESAHLLNTLDDRPNGTIVLWEALDRIVSPASREQDFLDLIDRVAEHLAMVFHRYLSGPTPKLRLFINDRKVIPWDPFLTTNPATYSSPVERIQVDTGFVEVQSFVLPHKDRITATEYDSGAGPDGWTSQQGFYVYRNERLLVAGSWLGLGQTRQWTKEEAHRLARIRLDIPNTVDAEWKIDIRKSIARPPLALKARLTKLAEDTREKARKVFAHRGQAVPLQGGKLQQVWRAEHFHGSLRYRIDTSHPAVQSVINEAGALRPEVNAMLRLIEETIPIQRIWLDTAEAKEIPRSSFDAAPSEVIEVLQIMYRNLTLKKGTSPSVARQQLIQTEPFHNYPELVMALPDDPTTEE